MRRSLLDTDTLSFFLKGEPSVRDRGAEYLAAFGELDFSVVSHCEIRRGLLHAGATRKLADFEAFVAQSSVWVLDQRCAREAAGICADLWRKGEPLDDADVLIAGIARANGLAVATNNVEHFDRVSGLEVENWLERSE